MLMNIMEGASLPPRLNTLHCGDCIAGLKQLGDGLVDLAFADPPFNIGYDYDVYHDKLESENYLAWSRDWTAEVVRVLKPNGTFWLAIGDEYAAELKIMLQRDHGLTCRSWVVWYYTFGVNCKAKFSRSHAHLFHMIKDPKNYTFNTEAIRVPSARQLVYGDRRANPKGRLPDDTWILRPQDLPNGFEPDQDTWYFPRVCGTFKERAGWHGCQMPEQLLGRIIRASSHEGDVVLDPFAGSGTTLAVAKKLGREYLGYELSEEYSEQINRRLKKIRAGDALDGAPEPLVSVPTTAQGITLAQRQGNHSPAKPHRKAKKPASRTKTKGKADAEPRLPGF
ncbi:MAG: site-specific DNA-methyltransferase [Pirellulales bacterium]|nr:site-specific DNA-methyltransferase [Pirellulales bacterium]